jgi:membrane protein implicated in regulation of membrane protease activity
MSDRKAYLWMGTGPVALIVVAVVLLLISDSTPARAVAFALFGIACVIAISLVFFAVGESEDAERAAEEAEYYADELESLGAEKVVAADAAAWFSRPGPRLIDGLEWLAEVLHPDRFTRSPAA